MLAYELQFFAKDGPGGEKTEPATQKKLEDARNLLDVLNAQTIAERIGLPLEIVQLLEREKAE